MDRRSLVRDTVLLATASLAMRCISLLFQMWLVSRIGAAGVGLYGLVGSVGILAATFAISGVRFASTRLISEELGMGRLGGAGAALRHCLMYSLFFGIAALTILFLSAERIGFLWIGDARTVLPLKIMSASLPFVSLSSVFYGYFTANRRIYKAAAVNVAEQIIRVVAVMVFLRLSPADDLELACASVSAGGVCSEILSFLIMLTVYLFDAHAHKNAVLRSPGLPSRMLGVALPLALSAYARTSLSTLEQLLVPRGLKASGMSANSALAGYGTIQGMVFPVIFFPSCVFTALAELLVPELTMAEMAGQRESISQAISALLRKCLLFSLLVALLLLLLAEPIGGMIYRSPDAGRYIKLFSLLAPIMYMDMVVDGCLKGLGQQVWSMGINILDALIGVVFVYLLLPRSALAGYVAIIFLEEIVNFVLSLIRLSRVTEIHLFRRNPKARS